MNFRNFIALLFLTWSFCLQAQNYPVTITGTILDPNGNPVSDVTVYLSTDSLPGNFIYFNQINTDANGTYSDVFDVPDDIPIGTLFVNVADCNNTGYLMEILFWNPANTNLQADFTYCNRIVNTPDSCLVLLTCNPDGSLGTVNFGEPPFTYLWSTGEVTATISPVDTGVYCVTVTDALGCEANGCITLHGDPNNGFDTCGVFVLPIMAPDSGGLFLWAQAFGQAPFQFAWSTGDTTETIPALADYCVTVTDATGCISTFCDSVLFAFCNVSIIENNDGTLTALAAGEAPFSYEWQSGETTATITPNGPGFYCVNVTDASGCVSSNCYFIRDTFPLDTFCSVFIQPVGDSANVIIYQAVPFGQAPFTFEWSDGSGGEFYSGLVDSALCVTVTDATGCTSVNCLFFEPTIENRTVSGFIYPFDTLNFPIILSGFAYLIDAGSGDTVDSVEVTNRLNVTYYQFDNVADGQYYVKVVATDPAYMPTYHFSSLLWNEAQLITVPVNYYVLYDVMLRTTQNRPGPGSISGNVKEGPQLSGALDDRTTDGLAGITILLFDYTTGEAIMYAITDANGDYHFPSLAYGTYEVMIELPAHKHASYIVTLGPDASSHNDLNFIVLPNLDVQTTTSILEIVQSENFILQPNPTKAGAQLRIKAAEQYRATLVLTDFSGKVLRTQNLELKPGWQQFEIQTEFLPAGIYFINLTDKNSVISTKLVKQ